MFRKHNLLIRNIRNESLKAHFHNPVKMGFMFADFPELFQL